MNMKIISIYHDFKLIQKFFGCTEYRNDDEKILFYMIDEIYHCICRHYDHHNI